MKAPTTNRITQTKHGRYNAVDYSSAPDVNIYAPEDGKITSYQYAGDCGNNLQYQGKSGYTHGFCHLEKSYLKLGQSVKQGQKIGKMGYTGLTIPKGPNGRHLHWVLRKGNTYYYPPSKITEEDMYKGKTAKTHYKEKVAWKKRYDGVHKNALKYKASLAKVSQQLKELQSKPPKTIIKEVDRIVEKIVEKPVVDPTLHTKLDTILNYLKAAPLWIYHAVRKGKK